MFDFGIFNDMYNKSFDFQGNVCSWNLRKKSQVSNNNGDLKKKKKIISGRTTWILTSEKKNKRLWTNVNHAEVAVSIFADEMLLFSYFVKTSPPCLLLVLPEAKKMPFLYTSLPFWHFKDVRKIVFIYNTTMHNRVCTFQLVSLQSKKPRAKN